LEGADDRRIQIGAVEKIIGNVHQGSFDSEASGGFGKPATNFWAPSQVPPLMNVRNGRKEFGVIAPADASIWKIRVLVMMERPASYRFRQMPRTWSYLVTCGTHYLAAALAAWDTFYYDKAQDFESDSITNAAAGRGDKIR
jgi:hypothetical protein